MSFHLATVLVLAIGGAAPLGTPLRQDGYSLRPPDGFRMMRMAPFHGTRAGAVPGEKELDAVRYLSAALIDGDGPDAASLLVTVVGTSFSADPSARDAFAIAAVRHFTDELKLPLALERSDLVREGVPRIEVLGTVRQHDQLRRVLVASLEGQGRHLVLTFSAPSGRFESLMPAVRASLDSFRPDDPPAGVPRSVAGALATLLVLAMFGSWSLWRRRSVQRRSA